MICSQSKKKKKGARKNNILINWKLKTWKKN